MDEPAVLAAGWKELYNEEHQVEFYRDIEYGRVDGHVDSLVNGPVDGPMDGPVNGHADGHADGHVNGHRPTLSYHRTQA